MSIPTRFIVYSKEGNILARNQGFFTISYGMNPSDIHLLANLIAEGVHIIRGKWPESKYLVNEFTATDYMFDLDDLKAVLPNKFKQI